MEQDMGHLAQLGGVLGVEGNSVATKKQTYN